VQYLQVAGDEAVHASQANVGVDTGGTGGGATLTPGNNTELDAGGLVDNGAARVTLARVLSALGQTSAEHGGGDAAGSVVGVAGSARDDGHVDLEEVDGQRLAAGGGGTPASNGEGGASGGISARTSQLGVGDGGAGGDGGRELHDGEVVVVGAGHVAGVDLDGGDLDEGSTGGAGLRCVSNCSESAG
jgi:hypothetical protein